MMEHANLHHHQHHPHQLQDGQLEPSSSSSSSNSSLASAPSGYGGAAGTTHIGWTQNFNLNINSYNPNCDRLVLNPRLKNTDPAVIPGFNSSMIQHLGPHNWHTNSIGGSFTSHLSPHEDLLNLARIKDEFSETNFHNFTDMLSASSPSSIGDSHNLSYMKDNEQRDITDLTEKLFLRTITSPRFPLNGHRQYTRDGGGVFPGRSGNYGQIFPSINISNLNHTNSSCLGQLGSFDMNSEALDLLNSTRFGASFGQESFSSYPASPCLGLDQMPSSPRSYSSPSQITHSLGNESVSEPKRSRSSGSLTETNKAMHAATKKTRVEPRSTCPPLKVRKEKLGDRVAALQQLVAPFGKTDTASVLMEAIGYIKFLQNQVETLSVPYMNSSRNKINRSLADDGIEEPKRELRSRGLCLVPISCMSYVTSVDGSNAGGGIWPPP